MSASTSNATSNNLMMMLKRIVNLVRHWYRLHVKRDPFLRAMHRWFRDEGDDTLRLDYPLGADSVVVDVGGYKGDFADAISKRFGCRIVVFEPVPAFHAHCVQRFAENARIRIIDCGLGASDGSLPIEVANDASSFNRLIPSAQSKMVKLRKVDSVLAELGIEKIDLMKINIEGGEYDLLSALIESGWIERIRYVQVQFHNFVPEAASRRDAIRARLGETHRETWSYEFVWESWCLVK